MSDFHAQMNAKGVKVYSLDKPNKLVQIYSRRTFYKLCLLSGTGAVQYERGVLNFDGSVLLISKPGTVCTWKLETTGQSSYTCVFTQEFFDANCFRWIERSRLFSSSNPPVFDLTVKQSNFYHSLFQKMECEQGSLYRFKRNLIQNQICVLLHSALQMNPSKNFIEVRAWSGMSAALCVELMEMQFPEKGQVLHFN